MNKKLSQFNSFFKKEDNFIGFNSFTQEVIVLDSFLYELVSSKDDINELENIHPDFFNFLQEKGFLINSNTDEIEKVRSLIYSVDFNETSYELTINPTMNCNFKCWYCYEEHIISSAMKLSTQNKIVQFTKTILESPSIKNFHLSWFGGEPLLEYKSAMVPLTKEIKELSDKNNVDFSFSFTSNGLLIKKDMIPFLKENKIGSFQITLDGDKDRHDKVRYISKSKGSYDRIVENIKLLVSNDISVYVRINYSKETIDGLSNIANDFLTIPKEYRKNFSFGFHQVWQVSENLDDAVSKHLSYFKELGYTISTKANLNSVRSSCYADKKNHATINYNGDVFKCTARDFKKENREGILEDDGTISWNEKYRNRMGIKLKNKPCLTCSILPICGGGCSQIALENLKVEYCVYNFDENVKLDVVKEKVYSMM